MRITYAAVSALLLACTVSAAARAQVEWKPSRNVDIVVASAAAGSSDRTARVLQKLLQTNASFPSVSVTNGPGGGGTVAWTFLTQHPGDAHYIATFSPTMLTNQILGTTKLGHQDLTPLAILLREYIVFAVNADSPSDRRQPGALSIVPTLREQGIDAAFFNWRGFIAPRGLKPGQTAFWDQAFVKAIQGEDWKKDLAANAWAEDYMASAETKRHLDAEYDVMKTMLTDLGVITPR